MNGGSMGIFGKKKLSEIQSAGQFVLMVTKGVQHNWPEIAKELNILLEAEDTISDDKFAGFEFTLAVIAIQLQALPNLLPSDQANRIREYVIQCISSPDLKSYPRETIQEYQSVWDKSLQQGEPPFYGISSLLLNKLECRSVVKLGGSSFNDPLLLDALSEKVITFGGPWWKTVTQEYKLVS
jgi:hypothetical protein